MGVEIKVDKEKLVALKTDRDRAKKVRAVLFSAISVLVQLLTCNTASRQH